VTGSRFPPQPWKVEETTTCFIVHDANGQALAYVYFEDEPGRRSAAKLLTKSCPSRKSYPGVAMMQSGQNRRCDDVSASLDGAS
jgi:hypothetical protein